MAGIDKTYIDGREYKQYRNWWIENYDKMVKELGQAIYLYPFYFISDDCDVEFTPEYLKENTADIEHVKGSYDFPVWNTSESVDLWLVDNCNIGSFRDRMLEVYPRNWKGFKGKHWAKKRIKQRYRR